MLKVIDLWPREYECGACGKAFSGGNKGLAMYEGCVVPHDWAGDWGGFPACQECFDKHERGEMPVWPHSTAKNMTLTSSASSVILAP